jgi:hypothetical protein
MCNSVPSSIAIYKVHIPTAWIMLKYILVDICSQVQCVSRGVQPGGPFIFSVVRVASHSMEQMQGECPCPGSQTWVKRAQ